ncbi:MAG: hypothetical protein QG603_781, partial [Patescibacteria group bacterium]|nr:hypothetical protein [Patescibacteria group bacterium]
DRTSRRCGQENAGRARRTRVLNSLRGMCLPFDNVWRRLSFDGLRFFYKKRRATDVSLGGQGQVFEAGLLLAGASGGGMKFSSSVMVHHGASRMTTGTIIADESGVYDARRRRDDW